MKIALFTDTYFPDLNGVTVSVSNYAKELIKKGHTVYIFAPKIRGYKDEEGYVYRLPSIKILSAEPNVRFPVGVSSKGLMRLLRMNFDIIHAHGNGPFSLLAYEVARAEGIPYVLTFHTLHHEYAHYILNGKVLTPAMIKRIMRFIANRCDGVITPSEKMKQKLYEFGFKKAITVIPNFIDTKEFTQVSKGYLHEKLDLAKDIPILLSVGRVGKEKNFNFLMEMFAKISVQEHKSHLVIVGQGPEKNNLIRQARRLGIENRVHFLGRIATSTMPEVYKDATIYVFASTTETQGICILEAAAAGLPFVVVNDAAFMHMVQDKKNGYAVVLQPDIFAQKVVNLLGDKNKQIQFGQYSQDVVQKYFQADQATDTLVAFYKKMQKKHKLHAKILQKVDGVAVRGVRSIRKTRTLLGKLIFTS